jgi:adenine-specific DNA-methyltransferase
MRSDNRIWFGADGSNSPVPKLFLTEVQDGVTPMTVWTFDEVGHGQEATRELRDLMDSAVFTSPKPIRYISRLIHIGLNPDDLILDFFSGSATTAHAVMKLNSEDGGNRKYILVQLPEVTDENSEAYKAGYKNICEIGKERIRRAGKKIKDESPLTTQDLDTGFRVYRLDDSNYENVTASPKDYKQDQLDLFANNIKADRNDLDLLYGSMLAWGVRLDLPMETEVVDGKNVYIVNDGDLVACFAEGITDSIVQAMADKSPLRILFRDSCFTEDSQKINIYEQFKQALNWADDDAFKNIKVI